MQLQLVLFYVCTFVGVPLANNDADASIQGPELLWPPVGSLLQQFVEALQKYISSGNFLNHGQNSGCNKTAENATSVENGTVSENVTASTTEGFSEVNKGRSGARHSHKGVKKHQPANHGNKKYQHQHKEQQHQFHGSN